MKIVWYCGNARVTLEGGHDEDSNVKKRDMETSGKSIETILLYVLKYTDVFIVVQLQ